MRELVFSVLEKYGISGVTLIILVLLYLSLKKKIKAINEIADGDVMHKLEKLEKARVYMNNSIQYLEEDKVDVAMLQGHCAGQKKQCLSKDDIYKFFTTKEMTAAVFDKVEISLKFIVEELKSIRIDIQQIRQKRG